MHSQDCSVLSWSRNVPSPAGEFRGLTPSFNTGARLPPLHTLSHCNMTHAMLYVTVEQSLHAAAAQWRTTQRMWLSLYRLCSCWVYRRHPLIAETNGRSRSCLRCLTVFMHEQLHFAKVHLFQPSHNQRGEPCLGTVWSTHNGQTSSLWGSDIKLTKLWWSKCTRVTSNVSNVSNTSCIREEEPWLTLIAEWTEEAG